MQGAVGHEVIVADGGVVEDGQLDLMAVGHRGGELLVVRGLVGLLLGAGLPDAHLVHADRHVGVQQLVALTEQRVAEGPTGGLQPHRLADAHLQVAVELHGSGHGHPRGRPGVRRTAGVASRREPVPPRLASPAQGAGRQRNSLPRAIPRPRSPPAPRTAHLPRLRVAAPPGAGLCSALRGADTWSVGRRRAGRSRQPETGGRARGGRVNSSP